MLCTNYSSKEGKDPGCGRPRNCTQTTPCPSSRRPTSLPAAAAYYLLQRLGHRECRLLEALLRPPIRLGLRSLGQLLPQGGLAQVAGLQLGCKADNGEVRQTTQPLCV